MHVVPVVGGEQLLAPLDDVLPLSSLLAPVGPGAAKEAIMQVGASNSNPWAIVGREPVLK